MLRKTGLLGQQHCQINTSLTFQDERARFDEFFDQVGVRSCTQCNGTPETLNFPLDVAERLAVEGKGQDVDPAAEQGIVRPQKALDRLFDGGYFRHLEVDHQVEAPPERRVDQFRMIGGRQQQSSGRPFINLLQDDGDQAFQFTNVGIVTATFGDGVNFVQQ